MNTSRTVGQGAEAKVDEAKVDEAEVESRGAEAQQGRETADVALETGTQAGEEDAVQVLRGQLKWEVGFMPEEAKEGDKEKAE